MKFGVYITTYQKPNRESISLIKRAIDSIKNQLHQDFKLFVIADAYSDQSQLDEIKSYLPKNSYFYNVPKSYGISTYPNDPYKKWCTGGLNATTHAINTMLDEGYEWICKLDHDDVWENNHLQILHNRLSHANDDVVFATTRGKFNNKVLPLSNKPNDKYYPTASRIFHSTTCVNFKRIPIRFQDPFKNGYEGPGDAWLWIRITKFLKRNSLRGVYVPIVTLQRFREGDMKNRNDR